MLSDWCIECRIALDKRSWRQKDLLVALEENGTPLSRTYVSALLNGRVYSLEAQQKIGAVLDVSPRERELRNEKSYSDTVGNTDAVSACEGC